MQDIDWGVVAFVISVFLIAMIVIVPFVLCGHELEKAKEIGTAANLPKSNHAQRAIPIFWM